MPQGDIFATRETMHHTAQRDPAYANNAHLNCMVENDANQQELSTKTQKTCHFRVEKGC